MMPLSNVLIDEKVYHVLRILKGLPQKHDKLVYWKLTNIEPKTGFRPKMVRFGGQLTNNSLYTLRC